MSGKLDAIRAILARVHNRADLCFHMQGASTEMMVDIILLLVGRKLLCWQVPEQPSSAEENTLGAGARDWSGGSES